MDNMFLVFSISKMASHQIGDNQLSRQMIALMHYICFTEVSLYAQQIHKKSQQNMPSVNMAWDVQSLAYGN